MNIRKRNRTEQIEMEWNRTKRNETEQIQTEKK